MSKTPKDEFDIVLSVVCLPGQSAIAKPSKPGGIAVFGVVMAHAD
jgi:hypothetical protein